MRFFLFVVCVRVCVYHPLLLNERGGETQTREGGTWVDGPMLDPPQQLSPEQSVKKSLYSTSFCQEIQPLPSTKIPRLSREPRLGLVLFFSNS